MDPAVILRRAYLSWKHESARHVCAQLSTTVTDDLVIDVPEFSGRFKIGASSHLLHRLLLYGSYEPVLAAWTRKHIVPNRDAIDIGANVGFFTVMMAKLLQEGRVLAVEPGVAARERLHWNIVSNGVASRVTVFAGLAARESGVGQLKVFKGMEEYSCAGAAEHRSVRGLTPSIEEIRKTTIDDLVFAQGLSPGFIKIDVEGFEMEVLAGSTKTITEYRPVILSELSDSLLRKNGSSAHEVIEFLARHRYRVIDPIYPRLAAGQRDYADLVAIPFDT